MYKKFTSIKKKFVYVVTILLLSIFLVVGIINISSIVKTTRENLRQQAVAFSQLSSKPLGTAYETYFDSGYFKFRENFNSIAVLEKNIYQIQYIDINGKIIFDSNNVGETNYVDQGEKTVDKSITDIITQSKPTFIYNPNNKEEITEIYQPYFNDWQGHPFTILYKISYSQINDIIKLSVVIAIFLVIAFFLVSSYVITTIVNKAILNPIMMVNQVAQRISRGKYGERIDIQTKDEIEELGKSTNKMARKLEQNIKDLRELDKLKDEFIEIAAQNFKIPINHIKFNIKYLNKNSDLHLTEKEKLILDDIQINSKRLELLSEDLINITAIQSNSQDNIFMPQNLSKILDEAIEEIYPMAKAKGIEIVKHYSNKTPILVDMLKIKQVLLNILDNAVRFTINKGSISVHIKDSGSTFTVEIIDHGVGIEESELTRLFQKFHKAPSSAKYNPEGVGLSLYLSKLIIDLHHGNIWAKSTPGKGSTFFVSLFKESVLAKERNKLPSV